MLPGFPWRSETGYAEISHVSDNIISDPRRVKNAPQARVLREGGPVPDLPGGPDPRRAPARARLPSPSAVQANPGAGGAAASGRSGNRQGRVQCTDRALAQGAVSERPRGGRREVHRDFHGGGPRLGFVPEVLQHGAEAEVLEPEGLREAVRGAIGS